MSQRSPIVPPPPLPPLPPLQAEGRTGGRAPQPNLGRLVIALIIIALGVVFLLDSAGVLDASATIHDWWPAAIIALGAIQLVERPSPVAGPLLVVALGVLLLLFTTDTVEGNVWSYVWPLAIVAAGLTLLTRWRGGTGLPRDARSDDTIVATGVFGGPDVSCSSKDFRGAALTAVLGGVRLDLRNARPAAAGATITATAVLGGIDILVPHGWQITTSGMPLFGGIEDKTDPGGEIGPDAPALHIDAFALFGGIAVKHDDH